MCKTSKYLWFSWWNYDIDDINLYMLIAKSHIKENSSMSMEKMSNTNEIQELVVEGKCKTRNSKLKKSKDDIPSIRKIILVILILVVIII